MIKKNKIKFKVLFLFLLVILIAGCIQRDRRDVGMVDVTGTKGLVMGFFENYPRDSYILSEDKEPIVIMIDLSNKGRFPEEEESSLNAGNIYISGFDEKIIEIEEKSKELSDLFLPGVSVYNPEGGFDSVEFEGGIITENIEVDKYEPVIFATVCYPYATKAGPIVCIDPSPFDENQEKACEIRSQTLTSQGAPIAVTKIEQEAAAKKIQFKIYIKNVGIGDVIKADSLEKCNPSGDEFLGNDDFDEVKLESVKVGTIDILDSCESYAGSKDTIKLFDGVGSVICSLDEEDIADVKSAYTTPLDIKLSYGYRSTISKHIEILKQ